MVKVLLGVTTGIQYDTDSSLAVWVLKMLLVTKVVQWLFSAVRVHPLLVRPVSVRNRNKSNVTMESEYKQFTRTKMRKTLNSC